MINKRRFLLQYFKNSVNNLPPSSLSQPKSKGLKLDSWLRRAAGRAKYINLVFNEEHGYICAMMNLGARGGCILDVFHYWSSRAVTTPQHFWMAGSDHRRSLGKEAAVDWSGQVCFLGFFGFFPGWKRLSSFLDSNLFASKMGCRMPISPFTSHQEMCSKTTLKGSLCPRKPFLIVFYP